jgi:hypothetical protein
LNGDAGHCPLARIALLFGHRHTGENAMLKIWGRANSSNVQKVLWTCEEIGIEFERIDAGGSFGKTKEPAYLKMNPNGLVRRRRRIGGSSSTMRMVTGSAVMVELPAGSVS